MAVPNRGPELQAVGYILLITAAITLLLRCFVRLFLVKSFGFDDWAMCIAMVFFTLFVTCALIGVRYGTGRHAEDLDPNDFEKAMKYWWFCYMWYCASMVASKISIGWFLLRITIRKSDVITIWLVLACTVVTGIVFFFVTLFQCSPQSYFWDKDQNGSCINVDIIIALTYLYSACSLVCDFTFALLPVVLIMKLNLKKSHKLALIPIVLMACVYVSTNSRYLGDTILTLHSASTAVLVRFAYVKDFKNPDFLWATIDIAIWSTTEQGLAITAGSLATLRPLFRLLSSKVSTFYGNHSANARASGHQHPPTIGAMDSKNKLNRPRGPFSLITAGGDDEAGLDNCKDIEMPERAWAIEKKSAWTMTRSRVDGASSEEELTAGGKHWDDSHLRTKTTCEAERR